MITIGPRSVSVRPINVVYSNLKAAEMELYCTLYMRD